MSTERALDRRGMWVVVVATLLAYGLCLGGDFVYDDVHSVRDNSALTSLANVPSFFVDVGMFSSVDCRLYRPALLTSFAVDGFIGDMRPWAFKLTNLLLHLTAALLVFVIARRFGARRSGATLAACLFGVHPMASEAVNTISGRSNLMMIVALLAAVRCHLAAMDGRRFAVLGTTVFGMIGLGCKEPAMILPLLLLILEGLRTGDGPRGYRAAALRVLPSVVLVALYLGVRSHFLGMASLGVGAWEGTDVSTGGRRGLATQLATMAVLLPATLLKVVAPHGMTMDPPIPFTSDWSSPAVLGGFAALAALTLAGLWAPRRRPGVFLGTCLAWGTAAPWVLKPLNLPFLEHRFYGTLAGLALVFAVALRSWESSLSRWSWRGAFAVPVVLFAILSGSRSLEFKSEERLWTIELSRNPESRVAMAGLAVVRMQQHRHADARPLLEALVETYPYRRDARMNLVEVLLAGGDPDAALPHVRFLVETWANNPFYRLLQSRVLAAVGASRGEISYFDAAVEAALHCLKIAAPKGLVYRTAASARRIQGDLDAAIELLDRSVAAGLDHSSVLLDRSDLLRRRGRVREARADLERARDGDPFNPRVVHALRKLSRRGAAPR
jgi:protein O-mannosyl-transferase